MKRAKLEESALKMLRLEESALMQPKSAQGFLETIRRFEEIEKYFKGIFETAERINNIFNPEINNVATIASSVATAANPSLYTMELIGHPYADLMEKLNREHEIIEKFTSRFEISDFASADLYRFNKMYDSFNDDGLKISLERVASHFYEITSALDGVTIPKEKNKIDEYGEILSSAIKNLKDFIARETKISRKEIFLIITSALNAIYSMIGILAFSLPYLAGLGVSEENIIIVEYHFNQTVNLYQEICTNCQHKLEEESERKEKLMNTVEKIVNLIKEGGLQQKEFARDLGLPENIVSEWRSGKNKSYRDHIVSIADYFGVTTDYLLRNGETEKNNLIESEERDKMGETEKKVRQKVMVFMECIFDGLKNSRHKEDYEVLDALKQNNVTLKSNIIISLKSGNEIPDMDTFEEFGEFVRNHTNEETKTKYNEARKAIFEYQSKPSDEETLDDNGNKGAS